MSSLEVCSLLAGLTRVMWGYSLPRVLVVKALA